jgi:hypothetical protein
MADDELDELYWVKDAVTEAQGEIAGSPPAAASGRMHT